VGGFEKTEIRRLAAGLGLGVASKRDSQEICFVSGGHHSDFVRAREPERAARTAGNIVTIDGRVVGQHQGYEAYTVGQRKGLGVAMGEPYFVVRIEPQSRQVVIGTRPALARDGLIAQEANWLVDPASVPGEVSVQIRYNGLPKPARVEVDPGDPARFRVQFDDPQLAVAPGQAAVVYRESRVLGGGWIV
jgi:tRNA-specific 2-thiouridylase